MRIFGPPSLTFPQLSAAVGTLPMLHGRFLSEMIAPLWDAAVAYFIDPLGMAAQCLKETDYARFTGKVKPHFFNPAGIKIYDQQMFTETTGDNPLAHQIFPGGWRVGFLAQAQHLCAYGGRLVPANERVDPRYEFVFGQHWCEQWTDLSNHWNAGSATYGSEIEALMVRLKGSVI